MININLCGRPSCCPELHKGSDGSITITDDYGGIVTMTHEQWDVLRKAEI